MHCDLRMRTHDGRTLMVSVDEASPPIRGSGDTLRWLGANAGS